MTVAEPNKFKLEDGRTIRILGDNILVQRIKLPETYEGGKIIVRREKEDATAIGKILAVGKHAVIKPKVDGPTHIPIDILEPGMMCAFLWFYAERHTNQLISGTLGEGIITLKPPDIALVWQGNEKYEVSDIQSLST